jgi:hypothetical protein
MAQLTLHDVQFCFTPQWGIHLLQYALALWCDVPWIKNSQPQILAALFCTQLVMAREGMERARPQRGSDFCGWQIRTSGARLRLFMSSQE